MKMFVWSILLTSLTIQLPAMGSLLKVMQVAPGAQHTCALMMDGKVMCWGYNVSGALGQGLDFSQLERSFVPLPVKLPEPAKDLVGASSFKCALLKSGSVWCWGANPVGQLGRGMVSDVEPSPAPVKTSLSFERIRANDGSACGWTNSDDMYCWGNFQSYSSTQMLTPTAVLGPNGVVFENFSVGGMGALGLTSNGMLYEKKRFDSHYRKVLIGETISSIDATDSFSAVTKAGSLYRWGDNLFGRLGLGVSQSTLYMADDPQFVPLTRPVQEVTSTGRWSVIPSGGSGRLSFTTLLKYQDGTFHAFGGSIFGELGLGLDPQDVIGDAPDELELSYKPGIYADIISVAAGQSHLCGITKTGLLKCWGDNTYGQLGDQTTENFGDNPGETIDAQMYVGF